MLVLVRNSEGLQRKHDQLKLVHSNLREEWMNNKESLTKCGRKQPRSWKK